MEPIILAATAAFSGLNAWVISSGKVKDKSLYTLFFFNLCLIFFLSSLTKEVIFAKDQDTWMHLALIRRTAEKGLFPGDPFYKGRITPPHYSLSDPLYSYISKKTGIASDVLWGHASPIISVLFAIAMFFWAKELTLNKKTAMLSSLISVYCLYKAWPQMVIPKYFSLIFYFLTLLYFLRALRLNRYAPIFKTGISLGLCTAVHLFTGIMAFITILSFFFIYICVRRGYRLSLRLFLFMPTGLILSAPWVINTYGQLKGGNIISASHSSLKEIETVFSVLGISLPILKPVFLWNIAPPVVWVIALLGMAVYIKDRKKLPCDSAVFLYSGMTFPLLILYTPIYSILKVYLGVWMLPRLLIVLPLSIWAGWSMVYLSEKQLFILKNKKGVATSVVAVLLSIQFYPVLRYQMSSGNTGMKAVMGLPDKGDKELEIYADMLADNVVLSDPYTSYILPYLTGGYVAVMPPGSGSPYINHEKRLEELMPVIEGKINDYKAEELLARYDVDYILFNLKAYSGHHLNSHVLTAYKIVQKVSFIPSLALIDQGQKYILFKRIRK